MIALTLTDVEATTLRIALRTALRVQATEAPHDYPGGLQDATRALLDRLTALELAS